jgi:hypothetical protein
MWARNSAERNIRKEGGRPGEEIVNSKCQGQKSKLQCKTQNIEDNREKEFRSPAFGRAGLLVWIFCSLFLILVCNFAF